VLRDWVCYGTGCVTGLGVLRDWVCYGTGRGSYRTSRFCLIIVYYCRVQYILPVHITVSKGTFTRLDIKVRNVLLCKQLHYTYGDARPTPSAPM
jgi:hypothetical protein